MPEPRPDAVVNKQIKKETKIQKFYQNALLKAAGVQSFQNTLMKEGWNGYLTSALPARWSKRSRKTHCVKNLSGVNSILGAAVSRGSGCGASATPSVQRELQWWLKAQDHCFTVARMAASTPLAV